jgi:predicted CXXCH cytochrome family protein
MMSGYRRITKIFLSSFSIILLIQLLSCSPARQHKTLSFFFDGVPAPVDSLAIKQSDSLKKRDSAMKVLIPGRTEIASTTFHPPYKQKQCGACHDQTTMGKFVKPQPELCVQCHDDFSEKFKNVHAPAASGFCNKCHNPHSADNKNLLIRKGRQLCLYCHESGQVMQNEAHKDIADANCTECHNPHGGDDKMLLR